MYCENCGKKIDEGGTRCSNCGTIIQIEKKLVANKGYAIIAICVVVAILLAVFMPVILSPNASPERVVKSMLKAYYDVDTGEYVKCFSAFRVKNWAEDCDLPQNATRREVANGIIKYWRFNEPQEVKILSCEATELSDEEQFYSLQRLSEEERAQVSSVVNVHVVYMVDNGEKEDSIYCIRVKGKWYIL